MQPRGHNYVRIYFSGSTSTCPVYSTLLLRPSSFTISVIICYNLRKEVYENEVFSRIQNRNHNCIF